MTRATSINAGKEVYVEWPVASNVAVTTLLLRAAEESRSRVAVGLQARWSPPVLKIKEILAEGRLAKY